MFHAQLDGIRLIPLIGLNNQVGIKGVFVLLHLPQVHMMDIGYPFNTTHGADHRIGTYLWWRAQHQDAHYPADFGKRKPQDIACNHQRDQGIHNVPAKQNDQGSRYDHSNRTHGIRQVMQKRGPDVHTRLGHRIGKCRGHAINQ